MDTPEDLAISAMLRGQATRYLPSAGLADRIRQQLPTSSVQAERTKTRSVWQRWWQALALYGAGVVTMASLLLVLPTQPDSTGEQVMAGHVRSLMAGHLTDVAASDHHTVKPWFAGKLDFSPPVVDLSEQDFALLGGRLDYIDGRPVAALVYRHGLHVLNLFVWPTTPAGSGLLAPSASRRQGYNLVHWAQSGMQAWAVSDMDAAELQVFADGVRGKMAVTSPLPKSVPGAGPATP